MELRSIFAANLKRCRKAAGLSQEELAHRADIDRTYVSMLERETKAATVDVIGRLAAAIGVEPVEFFSTPHQDQP